jgi:ribonuclease J
LVQIVIHRGTHAIGGSCIEIRSENSRLIIDLGLPLMARNGAELDPVSLKNPSVENGVIPNVGGLYENDVPSVSGVVLSHAHIDHYGLISRVHPSIPIYMGKESQKLIEVLDIFLPEAKRLHGPRQNVQTFEHWKPFTIGPFKITSYLTDHSAFGASSLLIDVAGKKIFYSGDFRGHGRKAEVFTRFVEKPRLPKIDCLLMEGTTLKGDHDVGFLSEAKVEEELYRKFNNQQNPYFIIASSTNIDRTVSIYRAAKKARKTLVLDLFQYHLLSELKVFAPHLPPFASDILRIYFLRGHEVAMKRRIGERTLQGYEPLRIQLEEIRNARKDLVFRLPLSAMTQIADGLKTGKDSGKSSFIYSMWSGYLEKDDKYHEFCRRYNMQLLDIHTSGHAYTADLKRLVNALKPTKLVPIHTLAGDDFESHFGNVVRVDDGQVLEI